METEENRFAHLTLKELTLDEHDSIIRLARMILADRYRPGTSLSSPDETRDFLLLQLAEQKNEVFCAIFLTNRHHVITFDELFYGTIDGASVHPREVLRRSIEYNAAAVIFAHNHPSGVAEPSRADETITKRLKDALALIDVRVLDHFVISATEIVSMAERGHI